MIASKRTYVVTLLEVMIIIIALIFLAPFYFVVVNSLKPFGEILKNAASWPETFAWSNYLIAIEKVKFIHVFLNSLIITTGSIFFLVITGSMASWWMVRKNTKFTIILFFVFVASMVTPFQSFMIPLMRVVTVLHLVNSRAGAIIVYLGYCIPFTVFLYHGFIKSVPIEMEESALIDGCNTFQTFFFIVFPLIRSMTVTVIILQALLIWNDFLIPLLILSDRALHTIPLAVFSFFGQYTNRWDYALATLVLGMLPIVIFFLIMQKYVVAGVRSGSVKG
ncbi:MAG: carbohydrate ABC transporter permease [Spirochaetaceae bacterium]|jgi:raffinose/stachyose/melibiose transport system permease protein|nr:carbohydrate ABC transporter permease [Spirochaetaceae bacterium]